MEGDFVEEEQEERVHVALLGDSVLDDFFWLRTKRQDVRQQLETLLRKQNREHRVTNLAVDESQIAHVLYGIHPNRVYAAARWTYGLDAYPVAADGRVYPLDLLRHTHATHAVLSVGGNDARAAFIQSRNVDRIYEAMVQQGVVQEFETLVHKVSAMVPQLILVYVYHPQITTFPLLHLLPPAHVVKELLIRFSPMFLDVARAHRLPIIDLSRTFNPYDGEDYGSTPIEPSNKSGQYIAHLITKVIKEFRFGEDPAKIYAGIGEEVVVEDIDETFDQAAFRTRMDAFLLRCQEHRRRTSCIAM